MDLFSQRKGDHLNKIKKTISSFISSASPHERASFLGCCLGTFCVLLLFLNMFKSSSNRSLWMDRLCKLNIIVIGISLVSIKYNNHLGCFPAIFICALDVIVCSMYGLEAVYSLIMNSLKTIIKAFFSLLIAAVALLLGQALLEIVPGKWK
eukprot:TRINITY_DN19915_c0_g1_i1.p1 TRINITY_DN19915_c0_g1~~TRINITY_DN19915_c0_g1_i1.p1  ORF type:complete len:151 (-),score=41.28 TRINITY_DN19915_c0_g1_i1:48-500(-)